MRVRFERSELKIDCSSDRSTGKSWAQVRDSESMCTFSALEISSRVSVIGEFLGGRTLHFVWGLVIFRILSSGEKMAALL